MIAETLGHVDTFHYLCGLILFEKVNDNYWLIQVYIWGPIEANY